MITSIELQMISRILTTESNEELNTLCSFDSSYYSVFKEHIEFILEHRQKYNDIPDVFTFQAQFPDVTLVRVNEPLSFLTSEIRRNKQHILLLETFNKLKDLGSADVTDAWKYLSMQCDKASQLDSTAPMDIIKESDIRSQQVIEFANQSRIPTGFDEIDKLMYGGLSTVEELLLIVARTNTGKSWVCTKMMESAQNNGFPVLYYSPEMQASYLGTRFDTWRGHFPNSNLFRGKYDDSYKSYIKELKYNETSAFVLEDKDASEGEVNVRTIQNLVRKHNIKLVIIDGLSYMSDVKKGDRDYTRYKNICLDLFKMSKQYGVAVVVAMQANRETRDIKDDKGEPFPSLYQVEGSDHPARIATQAFALRQVFDKHVLDIRLEKSRNANNQKPVLSYAWDVNTGNMSYLPGEDDMPDEPIIKPISTSNINDNSPDLSNDFSDDDFEDDEVEF